MSRPKPDRAVLEMMDSVFEEIELAVLREWPSKAAALEPAGDHVRAGEGGVFRLETSRNLLICNVKLVI